MVVVAPRILTLITLLKFHWLILFQIFVDLIVYDKPGAKKRFTVIYYLQSLVFNQRISIVTQVTHYKFAELQTLSNLYKNANWSEREAWDIYGVNFGDHPDLRRILCDYNFVGHPLRKSFPVVGFFEIRYCNKRQQIVTEPLTLTQEIARHYSENPWIQKAFGTSFPLRLSVDSIFQYLAYDNGQEAFEGENEEEMNEEWEFAEIINDFPTEEEKAIIEIEFNKSVLGAFLGDALTEYCLDAQITH